MIKVLLIEDESLFARSVVRRLEREGYQAMIQGTISGGKKALEQELADILLLDVRLPDGSGLDLLTEIRQKNEEWKALPVVIMTAYGELEDAVTAMKLGATDYLKKPVDLDELMLTLAKVLRVEKLNQQLDYSHVRETHGVDQVEMIGQSEALNNVRQQVQRIVSLLAKSSNQHPVILISGETGTGKDVVAHFYHQSSSWQQRPFVHVDCSALPSELIEAELFGHERGAFTHAHQAKAGLIEVAEDGTLFLDEIGELPLDLQAKLLNVVERRKIRRLGSTKEYPVNAHFVAASNRDLKEMVAAGRFRSDLYFRLNVLELTLPPLRERQQDIKPLVTYFVSKIARRYGLTVPVVTDSAYAVIQAYLWPGNIRELQHVLERAVMLCQDGSVDKADLLLQAPLSPSPGDSETLAAIAFEKMTLEQVEKQLIEAALRRTAGNVSQAARELGLTRMAMRYRIEKYQC